MINPDISKISSIFAHKSRSIMLISLLGGARTTSELAKSANIKPQTAVFHLNKMIKLNLISKSKFGKYSYYKIDREDIAALIETLLNLSEEPQITSLKESVCSKSIKFARLCFNHIGGNLAVLLFEILIELNYLRIENNLIYLTKEGIEKFQSLSFKFEEKNIQGSLCRDWSEKSYHISGSLGYFLYKNLLDLELIKKGERTRELKITDSGLAFFRDNFNLNFINNELYN